MENLKVADRAAMLKSGMRLGPDDSFEFHCTKCGKCCRNQGDILLNSLDLFRIARHLGHTPEEIAKRYARPIIGGTSGLMLMQVPPVNGDCPFMRNKQCIVHENKPAVCALFPLGRAVDAHTGEMTYFYNDPHCGNKSRSHTVREWLAEFGMEEQAEYYPLWGNFLEKAFEMLRDVREHKGEDGVKLFHTMFAGYVYFLYDIKQEYLPQFKHNSEAFKNAMERFLASDMNAAEYREVLLRD